eukprot:CAMPEP_0168498948 /NCGR_PEP_ID=MMETSP0228-20121227/73533_1 /TAXON_ID=133427 /ORGANISM="Protoceratium reticulatum, Strain CCCM 535 (=CCMP 1889)" /LENGTH=205 /DNA_ID=CAMNT_0008515849 /DNA_START=1 /DNA_END=616 /DNA_ORIENTATION=-
MNEGGAAAAPRCEEADVGPHEHVHAQADEPCEAKERREVRAGHTEELRLHVGGVRQQLPEDEEYERPAGERLELVRREAGPVVEGARLEVHVEEEDVEQQQQQVPVRVGDDGRPQVQDLPSHEDALVEVESCIEVREEETVDGVSPAASTSDPTCVGPEDQEEAGRDAHGPRREARRGEADPELSWCQPLSQSTRMSNISLRIPY